MPGSEVFIWLDKAADWAWWGADATHKLRDDNYSGKLQVKADEQPDKKAGELA